jgi:hypothetical protein
MAMEEREEPGADTAMFRAYVEHGNEPDPNPAAGSRNLILAVVAAIAVIVVLGLVLLAT